VIDAGKENERARRQSILENSPALFPIEENLNADGGFPLRAWPGVGTALLEVARHDRQIEEEAQRIGVDPDLLRATMYVEVSQGVYGYPAEFLNLADSILPMNVKRSIWPGFSMTVSLIRDAISGPVVTEAK